VSQARKVHSLWRDETILKQLILLKKQGISSIRSFELWMHPQLINRNCDRTHEYNLGQKWQRMHVDKQISCSQWGEAAMHLGDPCFSSFGEGEGVEFFYCSQCVPMKFSMCYQHVRGSLSLYPIYFALSFTLVICKSNPKEEITAYLFWECTKLEFLSFFGWWANQRCPSQKKRNLNFVGSHN
jgi:hypothetical protein